MYRIAVFGTCVYDLCYTMRSMLVTTWFAILCILLACGFILFASLLVYLYACLNCSCLLDCFFLWLLDMVFVCFVSWLIGCLVCFVRVFVCLYRCSIVCLLVCCLACWFAWLIACYCLCALVAHVAEVAS